MKRALLLGAGVLAAATSGVLPAARSADRPEAAMGGEIRVWGSGSDSELLGAWAKGFAAAQPGAHVTLTLHGPESAMMGVYTGVAEAALMAREMRVPAETMAFTWAWRYPPTAIEVANAGVDSARPNGALAVWVNPFNPLKGLTLAQLDAVYGAERKRGGKTVSTWGDLGLGGEWASRPVHVYGPAIDSVSGLFFRSAVLKGSYKWKAELREQSSDEEVAAAVAHDENGIGYGGANALVDPERSRRARTLADPKASSEPTARQAYPEGSLHPIPLAADDGGPFIPLTRATAIDRTYPLSRVVTMVINRKPNSPIDPETLQFLRFILGSEGQAIVARVGGCLPLAAGQIAEQLELLE